jgi:hypothetical protein
MGLAALGCSMTVFWWGLILIMFCPANLGWTPVSGHIGIEYDVARVSGFLLFDAWVSGEAGAFASACSHLILPALAPRSRGERLGRPDVYCSQETNLPYCETRPKPLQNKHLRPAGCANAASKDQRGGAFCGGQGGSRSLRLRWGSKPGTNSPYGLFVPGERQGLWPWHVAKRSAALIPRAHRFFANARHRQGPEWLMTGCSFPAG